MKHRVLLLLLLLPILLHLGSSDASACSCDDYSPSPYKNFDRSAAVFVGRVTGSYDVIHNYELNGRTFTSTTRYFKFAVIEGFKGVSEKEVDISVGETDSSCYWGYRIGAEYLVYAHRHGTALGSGLCTGTTEVRDADHDLFYIRARIAGKPEHKAYGAVMHWLSDPRVNVAKRPVAGVVVEAVGESGTYKAITDAAGRFVFENIPNGVYLTRPLPPPGYRTFFPDQDRFTVGEEFGEYIEFDLGWDTRVEGRVVDASGSPIARGRVGLEPAEAPGIFQGQDARGKYDPILDGNFSITGYAPGRYFVFVEVSAPGGPIRAYFGGSSDRAGAASITLTTEAPVRADLGLLKSQTLVPLRGRLIWSDGTPVTTEASVSLDSHADADHRDDFRYAAVNADGSGGFEISGFAGREYWLNAEIRIGDEPKLEFLKSSQPPFFWKAKPIKVRFGSAGEPVRLVFEVPKAGEH